MLKRLTGAAMCLAVASLLLSAVAPADVHGGKLARGKTGQGRTIRIAILPQQIKIRGFSIELRCSGGYTLVDAESGFLPSAVGPGGRIQDAQVGDTDEVLIRGRLTSNRMSGRIRVRDRLGKHRCSSPWVPFKAHARAG